MITRAFLPRQIAAGLALCLVALFLLGVTIETGLAVVQINTKSNLRFIPQLGTTYIPNAFYRHTKEGYSEGYFNSHGFRDYERTYGKPAGTFRILVFGDSYVEALQVPLADSFSAILERKLNEHARSESFEVLALGQSGFGTADAYMRYLNFGAKYDPDLVVLAFTTINDFHDNSRYLNQDNISFYFKFDLNKNLVLDRSLFEEYEHNLTLTKRVFQALARHSYFVSLVSERAFLLREQLRHMNFEGRTSGSDVRTDTIQPDEFSDLNIYRPEMSSRWQEAVAITKGIIHEFKASVEGDGGRFLLVTLSNAEQVHPHKAKELTDRYGDLFDFDQPERILDELSQQEGIMMLKLMPIFRDYHHKTGVFLHGFGSSQGGHWNHEGHRLAAEELFAFLHNNDLVPLSKSER